MAVNDLHVYQIDARGIRVRRVISPTDGDALAFDDTGGTVLPVAEVITGASGYSGFSGTSGYSGYSGTSGSSGTSGYSGYSGATGGSYMISLGTIF